MSRTGSVDGGGTEGGGLDPRLVASVARNEVLIGVVRPASPRWLTVGGYA